MADLDLIKDIARRLRYRAIPALLGRTVAVNSVDSVQADVLRGLIEIPQVARLVHPEAKHLAGTMAKYGLLDLTFSVGGITLDNQDAGGIALLRELGYLEIEAAEQLEGFSCFSMLAESIDREGVLLRLFLTSDSPRDAGFGFRFSLPEGYLPRSFRVEDACLTNSSFVWMNKHFYM